MINITMSGEDVEEPGRIAEELRAAGIQLIVVGIGKGVSINELDKIAGGDGKAFVAQTFDQLNSRSFATRVKVATCKAGEWFVICIFRN